MAFIGLIIAGAIIGALARLVVPGKQSMGVPLTVLLGVVGALVGGLIAGAISDSALLMWILGIAVAAALVYLVSGASSRRTAGSKL